MILTTLPDEAGPLLWGCAMSIEELAASFSDNPSDIPQVKQLQMRMHLNRDRGLDQQTRFTLYRALKSLERRGLAETRWGNNPSLWRKPASMNGGAIRREQGRVR